jgi:hypothetical protein
MILKKFAICAAALIVATIASQLAQAGGKGGVSASSPGHLTLTPSPPPTDPGKSKFAPGDIKNDTPGVRNAKELAPGDKNSKKK